MTTTTSAPATQAAHPSATTAAAMVADARGRIENLTVEEVAGELEAGTLVVDIREPEERQSRGAIPGSVHAARGMLEFYADPTSPYHRPEFDPSRRTILACASGGRSALAVTTLQELGYTDVAHLGGGFKAWSEAGRPVAR